jgi:hypothetical protein
MGRLVKGSVMAEVRMGEITRKYMLKGKKKKEEKEEELGVVFTPITLTWQAEIGRITV